MCASRSSGAVVISVLMALTSSQSFARGKECRIPSQATLTFSESTSSPIARVLLCSPNGREYIVSFDPLVDVMHQVSALKLVLRPPGKNRDDLNLLAADRSLHGYQPYSFGAIDYVKGAKNSAYGEKRAIRIVGRGTQLVTEVAEVQVEAEKPDDLGKIHYRFSKLVLQVAIKKVSRDLPKETAGK